MVESPAVSVLEGEELAVTGEAIGRQVRELRLGLKERFYTLTEKPGVRQVRVTVTVTVSRSQG